MNNDLEKLILYKKYVDMIYYFYNLLEKYPKTEKNSLVSDIKNCLYKGLRCIILYQKSFNSKDRINYLNELDVNLKILKVFIRLSYRKKYISSRNYGASGRKITDINNIMYGLIKLCQRQ